MKTSSCQIFSIEKMMIFAFFVGTLSSLCLAAVELNAGEFIQPSKVPFNHRSSDWMNDSFLNQPITSRNYGGLQDDDYIDQQRLIANTSFTKDLHGQSIYSSLLKILYHMKQQFENNKRLEDRVDLNSLSSTDQEIAIQPNVTLNVESKSLSEVVRDESPQNPNTKRLTASVDIITARPLDTIQSHETTKIPHHVRQSVPRSVVFSPKLDERTWKVYNPNYAHIAAESNQIDRPSSSFSIVDQPEQPAGPQLASLVDQQPDLTAPPPTDNKYPSNEVVESVQEPPPVAPKVRVKRRHTKKTHQQRGALDQYYIRGTEYRIPPQIYTPKPVDYENVESVMLPEQVDTPEAPKKYASIIGNIYDDNQPSPSKTNKMNHNSVHLQRIYTQPLEGTKMSTYNQQQDSGQLQQQPSMYTLHSAPGGLKGYLSSRQGSQQPQQQPQQMQFSQPAYSTSISTSNNNNNNNNYESSQSVQQQPQRDLLNQPQTIQITAVPNIGLSNALNPLIRVNGAIGLNNGFSSFNNGFLDPFGRQVFMVNAERRQVDWSFWIWPLLIMVSLPLILGALFVPMFLKTVIVLIQVLQSLGLLLPITNALSQQIGQASGVTANYTMGNTTSSNLLLDHNKT